MAATYVSITAFGAGNTDRYRDYAAELISLGTDVILVVAVQLWLLCKKQPELCRLFL